MFFRSMGIQKKRFNVSIIKVDGQVEGSVKLRFGLNKITESSQILDWLYHFAIILLFLCILVFLFFFAISGVLKSLLF